MMIESLILIAALVAVDPDKGTWIIGRYKKSNVQTSLIACEERAKSINAGNKGGAHYCIVMEDDGGKFRSAVNSIKPR